MKLLIFILAGIFTVFVGTAQENSTVADADGNVYHTVKIGNQVWTVENLRTTRYNDNSPIALDTAAITWGSGTSGKYCFYKNISNRDSIKKYGALYNCYAVDSRKLAPRGWHVPTDEDWQTLEFYLIENSYNWDGTKEGNKYAKSIAAKSDWKMKETPGAVGCDLSKNNKSGFSALPGGLRLNNGHFSDFGYYGFWWSAAENAGSDSRYFLQLPFQGDQFSWLVGNACSCSVRLIRD